MKSIVAPALVLVLAAALAAACAGQSSPDVYSDVPDLSAVFGGAQKVDLATSRAPSVVTLREVVKIPPPATPVLVKVFDRNTLPDVLEPVFADKGVAGVTMAGRYVAIIRQGIQKEYDDILGHELVHAYITMASPRPLPFWFQEGGAVHFSTDTTRRFYGQPSKTQNWVMEGHVTQLTDVYRQKLHSFQYLIDKAGPKRFNEWFRNAVMTGVVDARTLVGLTPSSQASAPARKPIPLWLGALVGLVVAVIAVVGYYSTRRDEDDI